MKKVSARLAPTHLVSADEAATLMQPHLDRISACIQHGWNSWRSDYEAKHIVLGARARAAIVYDEIVARATQEFGGVPGVSYVRTPSSFLLYFGSKVALRFKKIRKDGRCSNVPTRQQNLFSLQMALPGMESGTLVHAGYELNDVQRDIINQRIVCQFRQDVLWKIDLAPGRVAEMPQLAPSGLEPARVEIRPEAAQKKRKAKGGSAS